MGICLIFHVLEDVGLRWESLHAVPTELLRIGALVQIMQGIPYFPTSTPICGREGQFFQQDRAL